MATSGKRKISRSARIFFRWAMLLDVTFPLHRRMQTMLRCLLWVLALVPFSCASPVSVELQDTAADYYCGRQTYGLPDIVDCHPLLESLAYYKDNSLRVFDEEQLRVDQQGSWPGVIGTVGAAHLDRVVQVPRFYSLSTRGRPKVISYKKGDPMC